MHEVGAELFVYFPQELTKNTLYEKQKTLIKLNNLKMSGEKLLITVYHLISSNK